MRYSTIFLSLFLSIWFVSPLYAQKKNQKNYSIKLLKEQKLMEPVEVVELSPDYTHIIEQRTGGKSIKELRYFGDKENCYAISFDQLKGCQRENYNQLGIAYVKITEAKDTVVSFLSGHRFSSVGDYFYDDYVEVAIYDSISHSEHKDLLHKSGKILGEFQYRFLGKSDQYYAENRNMENPRWAFTDGLARVEKRIPTGINYWRRPQKRSFMDFTGRIITDSLLHDVHSFNGDLAIAMVYDENMSQLKYGCINREGKLVIPFEYSSIKPYNNEFFLAESRKTGGNLIDRKGELLVDGVFQVKEYSDELWLILGTDFNEYSFYFNPKTRKVLSKQYIWLSYADSDKLPSIVGLVNGEAKTFMVGQRNHKNTYGLVDMEGNEILPVIYDGVSYFNQYRLSLVSMKEEVAWVNEKGEFITGWFDRANKFEEPGIAWVCRNEKWVLINVQGEIISDWFEKAWNFTEGLAPVQVNHKVGYIDQSGAMVIEPR